MIGNFSSKYYSFSSPNKCPMDLLSKARIETRVDRSNSKKAL